MRKVLITESSLRDLLRELMNSHAPIFPNPVVDPQAAETNPTNINFVPDDKTELLSALRMLITNVDDENVPQVYVAIKDVIEKKEEEMKGTKAEAIIRSAVRKILKESFLSEALPVSPPPKLMPDLRLPALDIDKDLEAKIRGGATYDDVVRYLKKEKKHTAADARDLATQYINKVKSGLNLAAREKFLASGSKITKGDVGTSGKSLSQEERYLKFVKDSSDLREKLNKLHFLNDNEKESVLDGIEQVYENTKDLNTKDNICDALLKEIQESGDELDSAAKRFLEAFNQTRDFLSDVEVSDELSQEELDALLSPVGIVNSRTFDDFFGENFNDFSKSLGQSILKSISEKGYYSGGEESLEKMGSEVGLSISGVRKESLTALGKFIITLRVLQNHPKFVQYLDEPDLDIKSSWDPEL